MYVCIHVCMYVILKLGFERYERGNCPSWEGELSGGELFGGVHEYIDSRDFCYTRTSASPLGPQHRVPEPLPSLEAHLISK